ncbi:MAG: hypothetical protein LBO72_00910 [Helicobacteraceae bacterium]|jgi:dimeric dUTPase (all-alpha-NTP-PPase superfamily)|nr:hypothetical protein [Helicobacteraceae bacterium]
MKLQTITIKIDTKAYDISLNDQGKELISKAIDELGESVSVKKLLEAYLTKAALAEKFQAELKEIEKTIAAIDRLSDE